MIRALFKGIGLVVLWVFRLVIETAKLTLMLFSMVLRVVLAFVSAGSMV